MVLALVPCVTVPEPPKPPPGPPPSPSGLSGGVPSPGALIGVPSAVLSEELAVVEEHAASEIISAAAQVREVMRFVASLIKNLLPIQRKSI